jgi:hypothetical protein
MRRASHLVGCDAMSFGWVLPDIQRIIVKLNTTDKGTMILGKISNYLPNDMVLSPEDGICSSTAVRSTSKLARHIQWTCSNQITGTTHAQWDKAIQGKYCRWRQSSRTFLHLGLVYTVEAGYYNRRCYQSVIVIKVSGPKTLHLKSIKSKPFIIINFSVIVIKLQIIRVHI